MIIPHGLHGLRIRSRIIKFSPKALRYSALAKYASL